MYSNLSVMSDDFEKAVLFTFDHSGNVSPELRAQAQAMLHSATASPEAWQLCVSRLEASCYVEVKFWCLQTLHALAKSTAYTTLTAPSRTQIKRSLVSLGTQPSLGLPPFLRNKMAQTIVAIAAQEFPLEWPSFFQDMLGTLSSGPDAVDLFCRILVAVDEDIISLEVPRSAEEAKQSMYFKDSMREHALVDVATAWAQLIAAYKDTTPQLAADVLDAAQRYVHWIDISLVANDTFVPLLFSVLNSGADAPRAAAAGVLTEIIGKRMESLPKLDLIQSLGVVSVCAQWANGLPGADEEPELAVKYAKLLAALATEVLEAWKRVENSVLSLAAVGLDVGEEAGAEATAACSGAAQVLDALFPAVLTALRMGDDEIASAVVPFLLSYISRVRMLQKRAGGTVSPHAAVQLPSILEAIAFCARFSDDSMVYAVSEASPGEKVAADEEEAAMADRRLELFVLFKNTAKLCPSEAYNSVGRRLEAALPRADAPWQDAELALSLLFHLGEDASEEALKPGSGPLAALAAGVILAEVPAAQHRLVALALLETCARYVKIVAQQVSTLLQPAIFLFLGPRGLGHASPAVPPRAAFLFCRLVKVLRQQLHPVAGELLTSLQPHLAAIASSPLSPPDSSVNKAAGASSAVSALGTGISAADDRLYAFEAAGLLIGTEALLETQQSEWLRGMLHPLMAQLERNSTADGTSSSVGGTSHPDSTALLLLPSSSAQQQQQQQQAQQLLQQALDALTRASKGFSVRLCASRPAVGHALIEPLSPALHALQRYPSHKLLRSKFMAYVHRLVECLGPAIIPHLSTILWTLQQSAGDAGDCGDSIALLSQVVSFKQKPEGVASFVGAALPECVVKVHFFLGNDWDWSGKAALPALASSPSMARVTGPAVVGSIEDVRERAELQKMYYMLLYNIAAADMSRTLLAGHGDTLTMALCDLIRGGGTHVDSSVRKLCISALGKIGNDWLGGGSGGGGGNSSSSSSRSGGGGGGEKSAAKGAVLSQGAVPGGLPNKASSLQNGGIPTPTSTTRVNTSSANGGGMVTIKNGGGGGGANGNTEEGLLPSSPPIRVPLTPQTSSSSLPGLKEFFIQRFGCEVLVEGLAGPCSTIDVRDAASIALLTEVAVQLKSMHALFGDEYLTQLCGVTLPKLGWPVSAQEQLVGHITHSEPKALKEFLKQAIIELRQQLPSSQQQQSQQQLLNGGGGGAALLGSLSAMR